MRHLGPWGRDTDSARVRNAGTKNTLTAGFNPRDARASRETEAAAVTPGGTRSAAALRLAA